MRLLFNQDLASESSVGKALLDPINSIKDVDAYKMMRDYNQYKQDFLDQIANWANPIRPDWGKRIISKEATSGSNWSLKNDIVGKRVDEIVIDILKDNRNSKKWLMIFSGLMTAITGVTVGIGFTFGKKDKIEQQAEEESRKNVQLH